ncbi:ribonuclease H-like protein [Mycena capillaripes]|nr:ribonuclease H-like protein [Mycena capillaripes]
MAPNSRHHADAGREKITVYTDGSAINSGRDNARAGAGIYFGEGDPRNRSIRIPEGIGRTNNVGEMVAIKEAVEICPPDVPLEIRSDSRVSIDGLTKNLGRCEDEGFFNIENGKLVQTTVSALRKRRAETTFTWVEGHRGDPGNEAADKLAGEGSARANPDEIKMRMNTEFTLPGAKLQSMTQSIAYKLIRKAKMNKLAYKEKLNRHATKRNMEYATAAAADENDEPPPASKIWKSTKHKGVSRSTRFFLWMLLHDGYKCHWENIPEYEDWGKCDRCGITESMEHILTKCDVPGQKEIWELADQLWKLKTGEDLASPTIGQVMACAATKKGDAGTTHLYRILISESAHLIWRLRCERIHNRWLKSINNRLGLDCALTNGAKWGKKAIKKLLVLGTWSKTLKNEDNLPKDWTWEAEVLVGIS